MDECGDNSWLLWKQNRRSSMIGFCIVALVVGMDYSFMFTTIYLYLRDVIKTRRPDLFYALIIASFSLTSAIFGSMSGRFVDRTRKMKLYVNLSIITQIVGCLVYSIPYSIAYPFIGRLLSGIGDPFTSVCTGEIMRIYEKKKATRNVWILTSFYSVGFMIAPITAIFFRGVSFHIGSFPVTQFNVISLFMAFLLVVTLVVSNFLISDCSSQMDLKEFIRERRKNSDDTSVGMDETDFDDLMNDGEILYPTSERKSKPKILIISTLLFNFDSALIFVSTFLFMYCIFALDVLLPMIVLNLLKWSMSAVTFIMAAHGLAYLIYLLILSKICISDGSIYYLLIVCITAQIMALALLVFLLALNRFDQEIIWFVFYVLFWVMSSCIEEVLLRNMLAKMVPSHCQSFSETLRNGVSRFSSIIAALTAPLALRYLHWWATGFGALAYVLLVAFITRRNTLINIQEMKIEL